MNICFICLRFVQCALQFAHGVQERTNNNIIEEKPLAFGGSIGKPKVFHYHIVNMHKVWVDFDKLYMQLKQLEKFLQKGVDFCRNT